jgi:mRNA interferase MazF
MASRRRGDVVLVRLDPVVGSEVRKTRPCVVVSNDVCNEVSDLLTVVPLSGNTRKVYPFEVPVPGKRRAKAMANQIRTVSRGRVVKKTGSVSPRIMGAIEEAILIHLGIER